MKRPTRKEFVHALAHALAPGYTKATPGGKLVVLLVGAGLMVLDEVARAAHCPRCEATRTSGAFCDTCGWRYDYEEPAELARAGGGR